MQPGVACRSRTPPLRSGRAGSRAVTALELLLRLDVPARRPGHSGAAAGVVGTLRMAAHEGSPSKSRPKYTANVGSTSRRKVSPAEVVQPVLRYMTNGRLPQDDPRQSHGQAADIFAEPQADAGLGGNECDLSFVLNAIPKLATGIWTRVSGPGNASFSPNANTPNATANVTVFGTYVFRWTENQGVCRSHDEITVIFARPPVSDAGTGGNTCGLDFHLGAVTGSADVRGTWIMKSGSGTASFSPGPDNPSAVVLVSEYGRKVFTWIVTSGFCSDSADITVDFIQPPVANAGTNENNCGLEYYLRAVPSIGTGTWTRASGPGNASFSPDNHDPVAKVTVSAFGTYVFRWTEVNGECSSSSTVTIVFF